MSIEARVVTVAPFSLSHQIMSTRFVSHQRTGGTASPCRSPFPAPDGIEIMRRSPWLSCWWCGDPHDGRHRCDRCGQKFEHRMTMVAEAFQVDDIVVGEHIERSYPPA